MTDQPTTNDMRAAYVTSLMRNHDSYMTGVPTGVCVKQLEARFDRWLANVQAQAWDEGYMATGGRGHHECEASNPYREEARDA